MSAASSIRSPTGAGAARGRHVPIVSVLWGLALLGAASLSLLVAGTVEYRLAPHTLRIMTRHAAGEAAPARPRLRLPEGRPQQRGGADGPRPAFRPPRPPVV